MDNWRSVKVLVCFYSRYGSTVKLAEAVKEGALSHPRDQVRVCRVPDLESEETIQADPRWAQSRDALTAKYPIPTLGDLQWADALVLGSPAYFGSMASPLKSWIENVRPVWLAGGVEEKAGGAFCTSSTVHGGNEATILSMQLVMMHLGFVIVPAGYLAPALRRNDSPYGASAVTGPLVDLEPSESDLTAARALGFRVSHVARCLLTGHSEENYRRHRLFPGIEAQAPQLRDAPTIPRG